MVSTRATRPPCNTTNELRFLAVRARQTRYATIAQLATAAGCQVHPSYPSDSGKLHLTHASPDQLRAFARSTVTRLGTSSVLHLPAPDGPSRVEPFWVPRKDCYRLVIDSRGHFSAPPATLFAGLQDMGYDVAWLDDEVGTLNTGQVMVYHESADHLCDGLLQHGFLRDLQIPWQLFGPTGIEVDTSAHRQTA